MLDILAITGPIFAAIALGYLCTRAALFSRADMRVLGQFVIKIALPVLLFAALAQRDFGEILNPSYLLAYLAGTLAPLLVTTVLSLFEFDWVDADGLKVLHTRTWVACASSCCPPRDETLLGYGFRLRSSSRNRFAQGEATSTLSGEMALNSLNECAPFP